MGFRYNALQKLEDFAKRRKAHKAEMRESKLIQRGALLEKKLIKAKERQGIAKQEAAIRKIDAEIKRTEASNPSRGKQILAKLGKGALKAGKSIQANQKRNMGEMGWVGDSPLTKMQGSTRGQAKPKKKRVRIIEYE